MKNFPLIIFFTFVLITVSQGQNISFREIKEVYESFEHEKVIQLSNELLKDSTVPDSLLVDVYLMRAVSFYALGDESNCKNSFNEILKLKPAFNPDPSIISPKIIDLFNDVKLVFTNKETSQIDVDSAAANNPIKLYDGGLIKESAVRNIILPGWGQMHSGNTTKGIILSVLSTANLISMLYYISDTNKKENDYLNSASQTSIQEKYNTYNKSYKIRNVLIISYAAVWLFGQLDLFFFSDEKSFINETVLSNNSSMHFNSSNINLSFKIPF